MMIGIYVHSCKRVFCKKNICADISCNGFDGIKSVKDKEYQLVVLDVMMPGISGFEVLERIRDIE